MIQLIKKLLGLKSTNFAQLVRDGAVIIDVRTKREYEGGHIKGSINIPVDQLAANIKKIPSKEKPVITCCASGMRSAAAKSLLKSNGFKEVHNGGSWSSLQRAI